MAMLHCAQSSYVFFPSCDSTFPLSKRVNRQQTRSLSYPLACMAFSCLLKKRGVWMLKPGSGIFFVMYNGPFMGHISFHLVGTFLLWESRRVYEMKLFWGGVIQLYPTRDETLKPFIKCSLFSYHRRSMETVPSLVRHYPSLKHYSHSWPHSRRRQQPAIF